MEEDKLKSYEDSYDMRALMEDDEKKRIPIENK